MRGGDQINLKKHFWKVGVKLFSSEDLSANVLWAGSLDVERLVFFVGFLMDGLWIFLVD